MFGVALVRSHSKTVMVWLSFIDSSCLIIVSFLRQAGSTPGASILVTPQDWPPQIVQLYIMFIFISLAHAVYIL